MIYIYQSRHILRKKKIKKKIEKLLVISKIFRIFAVLKEKTNNNLKIGD
jgi:hypothetical protein